MRPASQARTLGGTFTTHDASQEMTLLTSGRIIKLPKAEREAQAMSDGRTLDRTAMGKVHDRLLVTNKPSFAHRVLRSFAPDGSGSLSHEQLHGAFDRLRTGLSESDKARLVARLDPGDTGRVPLTRVLSEFEGLNPLGPPMGAAVLRSHGLENNLQTRRPWDEVVGSLGAWRGHAHARTPGVFSSGGNGGGAGGATGGGSGGDAGSATGGGGAGASAYQQAQEDAYLLSLVRGKLAQHTNRLRRLFQQLDARGDCTVGYDAFVRAISSLRTSVAPEQAARLFTLAGGTGGGGGGGDGGADGPPGGSVNYEEFVVACEDGRELASRTAGARAAARAASAGGIGGSSSGLGAFLGGMGPEEVEAVLRSPLTHELQQRLCAKASKAHRMFARHDVNRDGYLSVDELTKCCSTLVPGISQHDVAALVLRSHDAGGAPTHAPMHYKDFIWSLVDAPPLAMRNGMQQPRGTGIGTGMDAGIPGLCTVTGDTNVTGGGGAIGSPHATWGHSPITSLLLPTAAGGLHWEPHPLECPSTSGTHRLVTHGHGDVLAWHGGATGGVGGGAGSPRGDSCTTTNAPLRSAASACSSPTGAAAAALRCRGTSSGSPRGTDRAREIHARAVAPVVASLAKTASLNATGASESAPSSPHTPQRGGASGVDAAAAASAAAAAVQARLARRNLDESRIPEAPVPNAPTPGDRSDKLSDACHLTTHGALLGASETYVRKGSPEYLGYQSDDAAARTGARDRVGGQPLRSSESPFPSSDGVLAATAHQKQRYVERQYLLAKGMSLGVQGEAVFGAALRS
ncbi:hypothetical protein FOA52_002053 [Chlamydomonas sp. UWO 241]|nr:hypothetical protein FOA52_002053 [Chlamydomonas sp. UWO 241]